MQFSSILFVFIGIFRNFSPTIAHKMVIFVPNIANSQVQFNARIAETLADGGNDVTLLILSHYSDFVTDVKIPTGVKVHNVEAFVEGASKKIFEEEQAKIIFKDISIFDSRMFQMMKRFKGLFADGCTLLVQNKEFLNWLENEKFDVAFAYMYSGCPIGTGKLESTNWQIRSSRRSTAEEDLIYAESQRITNSQIQVYNQCGQFLRKFEANILQILNASGMLMDNVAQTVGVPTIPSYVPPMLMESTDEMSFVERTKSLIGHTLMGLMGKYMTSPQETEIFRKGLNDPNFPSIRDLGAKCPLVMVNSNELYELPRPTLAKVVNIGGLGVGFESAKPLTGEIKTITETGKGTIVFSFGSVAPAHEMPEEWKEALLSAFMEFPDYQFVMRYVKDDLKNRLPKNVHLFKWLPQKDILLHNNTKAFITHGGYNSLQEAITAGVPMITIALFGDQPKNSKIAKKHGFAVNLAKAELSKETLVGALKEILSNPSYSQKVKRLSSMVQKQPIKPADLLLKWSNFLAEFKTLENLEPAGQKLNLIQYLSIDVFLLFFFVGIVLISVVFVVLRTLVRCVFCRKSRNEKKLKTN